MVFRLDLVTIVFVLKVLGNDIVLAGRSCEVLEHQKKKRMIRQPQDLYGWHRQCQWCRPVVSKLTLIPTVPIRSMHLFYALETLNNQITCSKHTHI